jgi:hypothetical protein
VLSSQAGFRRRAHAIAYSVEPEMQMYCGRDGYRPSNSDLMVASGLEVQRFHYSLRIAGPLEHAMRGGIGLHD